MVRPLRFQGSIPGPHDQAGVAAVYAAFALIAGVSAAALAIDTGRLYYAQRDLQKLATSAALDTARAFSGCYTTSGSNAGAPGTPAAVKAALDASIASNLPNRLKGDFASVTEVEQAYGNSINTLEFGKMDRRVINGVPTRAFVNLGAASAAVDAIQVNLARQAPSPLVPFLFSGPNGAPVTLRASAAAQQSPVASYSLGTTLANVTSPQPICSLLGGRPADCLKLPVVGAGLANVNLNLDLLAVQLGVANAGQLVNLSFPTNQLLQAVANVVNATGGNAQSGAAALLGQLASVAGPAQVSIDSLINSVPGVGSQIGGLPINVGDLLTQLSLAASAGLYPVKLAVPVNLPGVKVDTFLTLGASPTGSTGSVPVDSRAGLGRAGIDASGEKRTQAQIQQVNLMLRIGISTAQLPALGAVLGNTATINIGIDVAGATADSFLASLNCPAPLTDTRKSHLSIPVTTSAAVVTIGTFTNATETQSVMAGNILSVLSGLVTIKIPAIPISLGAGSADLQFQAPYADPQTVGVTSATLQTALNGLYPTLNGGITVTALGIIPINLPSTAVVAALAPVLNGVAGALDPIVSGLGISLGGAVVKVTGVDFGTNAGDVRVANATVKSTNSVPVLFNKTRPFYDGEPVQTLANGPATR